MEHFQVKLKSAPSGSKSITIPTLADVNNVRHGDIKISLTDVSNVDYEVSSLLTEQEINVKIRDQVAPVVSITSILNNGRIIEGNSFEFSLVATPEPLTPISVDLKVVDTNNHFDRLSQSKTVSISNAEPVEVTLYTAVTSSHEKGQITVSGSSK